MSRQSETGFGWALVFGALWAFATASAAEAPVVPQPVEEPVVLPASLAPAIADVPADAPADDLPPDLPDPQPRRRPPPFPTSLGGVGGGGGGGGFAGGLGGFDGAQANSAGVFGSAVQVPRLSFNEVWYPNQPVRGQNSGLEMENQDLSLTVPVWQSGRDSVSVTTNVRSLLTETHAILPDTGRAFPTTLWSIGLGANYTHVFQNGWSLTTMTNIGSSSDDPFDGHNLNVSLGGILRIPAVQGRDSFMIGLMYSPTSELPFPMPVISYYWRPSDQFSMNIGLPFSMRWQPLADLRFDFSYVPIRNVHARITYRLADGFGVYTGFDWSNESYFLTDRSDDAERFFYYEERVVTGLRYDLNSNAAFDLSGGYAFNRFFFTGQQWSDQNHDRIDVGNGVFLTLRFMFRY
jgi:hypothetical protein